MPKQLALLLCFLFIAALFLKDRKERPMTSWGLWLPLIWITIIGTRPLSTWFGAEVPIDDPSKYLDGSPFDRNVFLVLIVAGVFVLLKRKVAWGAFLSSNGWFFAFIAYCFISIAWSDYSFVSFKRWTKEAGNIIMVLIVLTETDPAQAIKSVIARYAYIVLPLSVAFIKYFPDLGRYYSRYTYTVGYGGITMNKNALGALVVLCGLFLIGELINRPGTKTGKARSLTFFTNLFLLLMAVWLLIGARSSTAMVCLALGAATLFFLRLRPMQRQMRYLGLYGLGIGFLALVLFSFPGIIDALAGLVGRDATLTGRTELWTELKKMALNPLIGTGYQSFWLGPRAEYLWARFDFHPNQAHNGYLETYLNLGLIGLALLLAFVVSAGRKLKHAVMQADEYAVLRFSFFAAALASNWTEASFNTQTITWMMLMIAIMHHPAPLLKTVPAVPREYTSARFKRDASIPAWTGQQNQKA